MNLDGDKSYTIVVNFVESYNFLVRTFFIWNHFDAQIRNPIFISEIWRIFSQKHIFKNSKCFRVNLDGGKLYTEIVYLHDIYNFVVLIMSNYYVYLNSFCCSNDWHNV
jgi:hypothetical protein